MARDRWARGARALIAHFSPVSRAGKPEPCPWRFCWPRQAHSSITQARRSSRAARLPPVLSQQGHLPTAKKATQPPTGWPACAHCCTDLQRKKLGRIVRRITSSARKQSPERPASAASRVGSHTPGEARGIHARQARGSTQCAGLRAEPFWTSLRGLPRTAASVIPTLTEKCRGSSHCGSRGERKCRNGTAETIELKTGERLSALRRTSKVRQWWEGSTSGDESSPTFAFFTSHFCVPPPP